MSQDRLWDTEPTRAETTLTAPAVTLPASALIVEVPQADDTIGPWRQRLDELAPAGVPAHVTCLFPIPHEDVVSSRDDIADALTGFGSFDYEFDRCAWFGDEVLWLAPHDPRPFERLTETLTELMPHLQPYEGRFDSVIPHLTIGHKCDISELRRAEQAITPELPIRGHASHVSLYSPVDTTWTQIHTFSLT